MKLNQLIEQEISSEAVELLNMLAANAIAVPVEMNSVYTIAVEPENWNATVLLLREIFEAEILIADEDDWLSFRILQSIGVKDGQMAYQFTPTFAQTLR